MDQRFAVPGVEPYTLLAEAAPALLQAKAKPLFELEEAAASGADMDAVHDMRVASRRLREAMRVLAPVYPPREFDAWYRRVRGVTRALGPVRDSDVFVDDFCRMARRLGEGGKRAVAFLVGFRLAQRERELAVLNRRLARLDLAQSRRSFHRMSRDVLRAPEAKRSLTEFAHAAVAQRFAVVFGALPAALNEANVPQQHLLRIDFKRLRYAVEVFAPCYADEFDGLHATLTTFQDTLGDLHDIHVFLDVASDPERVSAAKRAGVSEADMSEVTALLEQRAHTKFGAFACLAAEHPAAELLPALLLPLARTTVKPAAVAPETAAPEPAPAFATATDQPPAPSVAEALAPAVDAPAQAVVLEPPQLIPVAALVDPWAQPWRSDVVGLSINPPIVIGAEPWAHTSPVLRASASGELPAVRPPATPPPIAPPAPAAPASAQPALSVAQPAAPEDDA